MDCSIVRTRHEGFYQVSTTDFFFPLVEDPYEQGWIACANVLSDLFALGLADADNLLMLLGACVRMAEPERDIVTRHLIRGFDDCARAAGTRVTGGQTTLNEWPLIGGVAMTAALEREFIRPELGRVGDRIVLTKPLGTQVAVNLREWITTGSFQRRLAVPACEASSTGEKEGDSPAQATVLSVESANAAYVKARRGMCRLNRTAARLMHHHGAHGATDVTGFGVRGHCANLASNQQCAVDLVMRRLPVIAGMCAVDDHLDAMFQLRAGFSAETSGGLLVLLPSQEAAEAYCAALEAADGEPAWIIGEVVKGTGEAVLADDLTVIEV
jgi:selenide, water dikinase